MAEDWLIELLTDRHERGAFSCGKPSLDLFLHTQAGQYNRKGVGRTYVAVRPNSPQVIGYYTLAASSVPFAELPAKLSKKLPRHPVPTILLGRLAVDLTARGLGLGSDLLIDATRRSMQLAEQIGVFAVHAHALDDEAKGFYFRLGFESLPDQDRHMILPIESIRKGFNA